MEAIIPLVSDLMSTDLFVLSSNHRFNAAKALMNWQRIRHIPVVNEQEELVGLVTHRDVLSTMAQRGIEGELLVKDVMNKNIITVPPNMWLSDAAKLIIDNKFGCLPVVNRGRLVGILTEADFVKSFQDWDCIFRQKEI